MGKDCVDLHCLKTQIKGDANESVAQIKPLGWIYIYIGEFNGPDPNQ